MLYLGFKYVLKATKDYEEGDENFNSSVIGMKVDYWDEKGER